MSDACYHIFVSGSLIPLSAVTSVAFDCSDDKTLMGMIKVGSMALVQYNSAPVSCCNLFTSLLESAGLIVLSFTNCVLVPYIYSFDQTQKCI
jgi:hypothetical protein